MLLRDNIYRAIRSAILTCELQPGQELREQILAERYHVSRSPIRDSLLRLEYEHLVTVLPRQGYRVNPIAVSDVEDITGLRMLIEPACAAAAARRDDDAVTILDRFRDYHDNEAVYNTFLEYNCGFHRAVADLSGNPRMAAVMHDLLEQFDRLVRFSLPNYMQLDIHVVMENHRAIIDAIQAHDADRASQLARHHVEGGRARLLESLRQAATERSEATAA